MRRRDLLMSGTLGSILGALGAPAPAAAAQAGTSERALVERLVDAIADLRRDLNEQRTFTEITAVREAQKQFLRANSKLPDFVEVGTDVWFQVHDWHIRWQVPLQQGRDAQGRLTIALDQTLVVLRPDVLPGYVGIAYDAR